MKKTVLIVMILTIISQITGFGRDLTLAYFYGTSNISDVYLITLTITGTMFVFLGTGISTGYIPLLSNLIQNVNSTEGLKFTNNLINLLLIFSTILITLGLIFTESIVIVFAYGFDKDALSLAVLFTRISIISIYFTTMIYIFKGYLQVKDSFFISTIIGIPLNVLVIISIAVSFSSSVFLLIIGYVFATFVQFFILIIHAYRKGYRYKTVLDFKDKNIKKLIVIAIPVIIGTSVDQINTIVDRTIASQISIGGISALNYAYTLTRFALAVVVVSTTTVLFPFLSKKAANSDLLGLKAVLSNVIVGVILLIIPATLGFMMLSEQIVTMLFGRGAFDKEAIIMTANALFYYSIGLIGYALRDIFSSVFYSLQDSKTPMINAAIAMAMNIILNVILSKYMGISGLALATSISAIFCTALLTISLKRKLGYLGLMSITTSIVKVLASSAVMGMIIVVLFQFLKLYINLNLSLLITIVVSSISYFVLIYFMNIKEVNVIVNGFKEKLISS
ncbi:murein biosynthesis integral membrane protein MurJ [Planomicrobium sp. CPCC 101110]|uniref:murein biosynthesis integral membrane protein MurJ n=1 Tax=Planomicrobium sp. CPCC 101110 TaxID=2599619 RepID=UPI0011B5A5CB|nr:murein biosynthesis integral membrane protein MurJ [Planomicrobium sp. CPCC 101110]TWT27784.1 murein biosynthesis integral membrane protein MurJ [Planomicrobium sp. CPCC 101110]